MPQCLYCNKEIPTGMACAECLTTLQAKRSHAIEDLRDNAAEFAPVISYSWQVAIPMILGISCLTYVLGFSPIGPQWALSPAERAYSLCIVRSSKLDKTPDDVIKQSATSNMKKIFSTSMPEMARATGTAVCEQGKWDCAHSEKAYECQEFIQSMQKR